jgi:hypothetical protein
MVPTCGDSGSAHPKHNVLNHIEVALAAIDLHRPLHSAPFRVLHD